ncbi:hypothetical protein AB0M45_25345 [Nocardia sp. NPDC051787]|uniref:hypothetical protein n=1 Tax=Nocardia sp. NPDC051787 TaxID=3155415 RepID=UPI003429EFAC
MKGGAKIAVGVGAGYLLGRTRKMRLALALAGAAMSRRYGSSGGGPTQELLERGTSLLKSSPELAGITETVREELMGAMRAAAVTAASNRIDALNARLQRQAAIPETVEEPPSGAEEYEGETTEDEQGYAGEDMEDEYPAEEEDEYPEEEGETEEDESEESQDESEESRAPTAARRTASTTRRRAGEPRSRKSGAPDRTAASPRRRRIRAEAEEAPIRRTRR